MKRRGECILLVFSLVAVTLFPGPSRAQVPQKPSIDSLVADLIHHDGAIRREALARLGQVPTEERRLRAQEDAVARWIVLVEGVDAEAVQAACRDHLSPEALGRRGASAETALGLYRLVFSLLRLAALEYFGRKACCL